MKKIAVITATRAEYGLLSPLIKELRKYEDENLVVDLVVTGTHLSEEYGLTINEINDRIDKKMPVSVKSETELDISNNQAEVLIKFTDLFVKKKYEAIIILGDRFEMLSVAIAAGNTHTPIFHLCGGDTTEGALDEWVRHSITKMSYLHFVTNEMSRKRVIQLGESPDRVYNYGSTSIDNILNVSDMSKEEALKSIGMRNCNYALCTFHPITMEDDTGERQVTNLINALKQYPQIEFIISKSNADLGGARINRLLETKCKSVDNCHLFDSLGVRRYLSLMKYAEFVIGNSSSGIIETPSFHIPTINIGDRQKGRLRTDSIIDTGTGFDDIKNAIAIAIDKTFLEKCKHTQNPYGDGDASKRIAKKIIEVVMGSTIDLKKSFYRINN